MESGPLQTALYGRLNGAITGTVADEVAPGTAAPYTVIGEGTARPDDTHTERGSQDTVTLHTYDNRTSSLRIKAIVDEIEARLHRWSTTLSTGARVTFVLEFVEYIKEEEEPGKVWRHAVQRYRAFIHREPT